MQAYRQQCLWFIWYLAFIRLRDMVLTMNGVLLMLLLFLEKGFSVVPPPVNVTIQCHNFRTVAYWNYSQPSLHPRFSVELAAYEGARQQAKSCLNITHHHCDVSGLVLGDIQEAYLLRVEALAGSNKSDAVLSSEFTYNMNKVEEIHCSVDFPPVILSVQKDQLLQLQFPHPLKFYRNALRHLQKNDYQCFTYSVEFGGQDKGTQQCQKTKGPCEGYVSIPPGQERPCILLKGRMNNIQITTSKKICFEPQNYTPAPIKRVKDDLHVVVWSVVAAVVLVVFALVGILILARKTKGHSAFPKIMASVLANPQKAGRLLQPESDATSEVLSVSPRADTVPDSPRDHFTTDTFISEEGSRFPIGVETGQGSGLSQGQSYDGSGQSEQENSFSPGIEESSGYDRPHVVLSLEISPGDRVEGYRPYQD